MLSQISPQHLHHVKLWYLVQHSLTAYHQLIRYFGSAEQATEYKALSQWQQLPIHAQHKKRAEQFTTIEEQKKFEHLLHLLQQHCDFILTAEDALYPTQLLPFDDHPPLIFGQGNIETLQQPQIAMVGSRKTSPHGSQIAYDFSYYLAEKGLYITSGLAHGIDYAAHQGGLAHQRTIAVIGTGLDQVYPAQNKQLQQHILAQQGAVITELLPTSPPLQFHFPRRNRIISALSLGTLVVEAGVKSGSLSTARWAMEQGKPVFAIPGHIYNDYHQGCHLLIREGAILVDNPEQIFEELQQPLAWQTQQVARPTIPTIQPITTTQHSTASHPPIHVPEHLQHIYQCLEWTGQDIDQLHARSGLDIAILTDYLMQLELFDLCLQQAGVYLRKR